MSGTLSHNVGLTSRIGWGMAETLCSDEGATWRALLQKLGHAPDAAPSAWRPIREDSQSAGPAVEDLYRELLSKSFRG